MKKIISLFSVIAMLFTLMTTVAFAGGEEGRFYWEETAKDDTSVTLALVFDASRECSKIQISFDTQAALAAGVKISMVSKHEKASAFQVADASAAASKQVISVTLTDSDISMVGKVVLGEVKFDFADASVSSIVLPAKKDASVNGQSTTDKLTFTNEAVGYTVEAPKTEVELPADRTAAVKFAADENTFVEITKGAEVKNYFLPSNVKGDATVYGLLKYTVDGTNVASGDIFTIKAVDMETKAATDVATITVE